MIKDLSDFPVVIELPVNWGEMDAFGHVNNVVYFRYFESARIAYIERLNREDFINNGRVGVILASVQAKFIAPLFYPDTIKVGTRAVNVKEDRFDMEYAIQSVKQEKIVAIGTSTIVMYDYKNNCKMNVPADLREQLV